MFHLQWFLITILLYQCHSFSTKTFLTIQSPKNDHFYKLTSNNRNSISKSIITLQNANNENTNDNNHVRLNKVLKETHSRREADALIKSGRITINGKPIDGMGVRVIPYVDSVELDGVTVTGWEQMNGFFPKKKKQSKNNFFEYIKYWKPKGVTCTTETSVRSNIIDTLRKRHGYNPKHRVYPVGRLDKDTTGLILLTSDGRLPNSVLRGQAKQPKVYEVTVDRPLHWNDIEQLENGVVITTVAMRDGRKAPPLTARTKPCQIEQLSPTKIKIILMEGRNRQVRKMLGALNYNVIRLHRVQFMGIYLDPLMKPGDWIPLSEMEMKLIDQALSKVNTDSSF